MAKIGAFIPARYAATRFPAKLMQQLVSVKLKFACRIIPRPPAYLMKCM